jgi:hypothetical protein
MKFKTFNANSATELEKNINEWLAANANIHIIHATQSEAGTFPNDWAITFSVIYDEAGKTD